MARVALGFIKFIKFTGKWLELENILREVNQSQKNTHGMHGGMDIREKVWNTHVIHTHRPYVAQEEGRPKC